ncbi:putative diguanylate cyclase YedQ [Calidithermus roseus]|uniref:Putative diguanylate cyclase YedQ n=1 Tax=Calidithermus roseus TaxID=1644118 RepID=A0A399EE80_9DEIN|nr:putative diguanylate cyclase YedQ [Calidithermus roseus]
MLGPELLLCVIALGFGLLLLREARHQPVWQGAAWGLLLWALEELAWWIQRSQGFSAVITPADVLFYAGAASWMTTLIRLEVRATPRWGLLLVPALLLCTVALLARPSALLSAVVSSLDLLLMIFALPVLEPALRGQASVGRLLLGLGIFMRVSAHSAYYWLGEPALGMLDFSMWGGSYALMGLGAYLEVRKLERRVGFWPYLLGIASTLGVYLLFIHTASLLYPSMLVEAALLAAYPLLAVVLAFSGVLYRNRRWAEERLERWTSLLERLGELESGVQTTQNLGAAGLMRRVLDALQPVFPDLVGIEIRNRESVRVGKAALYVKHFPLYADEAEGRLYFERTPSPSDAHDLEVLGPFVAEKLRSALSLEEWRNRALTDPLTGLLNRRGLERQIPRLIELCHTSQRPLSVAMLDLDHFKRINDTYGHSVGDRVLQTLAGVLRHHLRTEDLAVRWGGEEFALFLYGAGLEEARRVLERIRTEMRALEVEPISWNVTLSAGLTGGSVPASEGLLEAWILQADWTLLHAKEAGRDRVMVTEPPRSQDLEPRRTASQ